MNKKIDLFWDNWLDSIERLHLVQEKFEKDSLKMIENFEQLFKPTAQLLKQTEKKGGQLTDKIYEQLKKKMVELTNFSETLKEPTLLNDIEKVSKQTQQLFWSSQKILFDFLAASQVETSETIRSIINEQHNKRAAILKRLSKLVNDIKNRQKSLILAE